MIGSQTLASWLVACSGAAAVGLGVVFLAWPWPRRPRVDDPASLPLPALLRGLQAPLDLLEPLARRSLRGRRRAGLARRLRHAGLLPGVEPERFEALRMLGALLAGTLAVLVLGAFVLASGAGSHGLAGLPRAALLGGLLGWVYPTLWLRRRVASRSQQVQRVLPFYLDLMTLCVEAGLSLQLALERAVYKGPPGLLQDELRRVLRELRAGRARVESLRDLCERVDVPGVVQFAMAIVRAERMGLNLGPVLRMQADQQRSERFLRAERLGLEAPVKMLAPLVLFVFPCTFIVIFFPLAMRFLAMRP